MRNGPSTSHRRIAKQKLEAYLGLGYFHLPDIKGTWNYLHSRLSIPNPIRLILYYRSTHQRNINRRKGIPSNWLSQYECPILQTGWNVKHINVQWLDHLSSVCVLGGWGWGGGEIKPLISQCMQHIFSVYNFERDPWGYISSEAHTLQRKYCLYRQHNAMMRIMCACTNLYWELANINYLGFTL